MIHFSTDDVRVYLAPAGAGKTEALMSEMTDFLLSYRPDEIAFVTFTRKGVTNGIDRALAANKELRRDDLVYFKTLHALCFRETGLKHKNIIERSDLKRFNDLLGFHLTLAESFENTTEDDKLLQRYDALRSGSKKGIFIERACDEERYERLVKAYESFKEENDLVDFYDCLIEFKKRGKPIPAKVACIDEAQDLTLLQWEVCQIAFSGCEKIRIAGDDYQGLFSHAGARPDMLIEMAGRYDLHKLERSYRLPVKVYNFAHGITRMIQEKVDKDFTPIKEEEGFVRFLSDRFVLSRIVNEDLKKNGYKPNRWYFLFRNNCFINDITVHLDQFLIPYHTPKGFCIDHRDLARVKRYYNYRKLGFGSELAKKVFCETFQIKDIEHDFTESSIVPGENRFIIKDYTDRFGIEKLDDLANGTPYALASTIHRVKGGEADYVAVFLDCTRMVSENVLVNLDEELRVLYVACTRARKGLYLIPSIGRYGLDNMVEQVKETCDANVWS